MTYAVEAVRWTFNPLVESTRFEHVFGELRKGKTVIGSMDTSAVDTSGGYDLWLCDHGAVLLNIVVVDFANGGKTPIDLPGDDATRILNDLPRV